MDFQPIIDLDKQLLLYLNGSESLFLDAMVVTLTNAWTWVPLYISLLIVVIKNSESALKVLLVLVMHWSNRVLLQQRLLLQDWVCGLKVLHS